VGKICDPPPFTGGQCPVRYFLDIDVHSYDQYNGAYYGVRRHRNIDVFGPLDNLEVFDKGKRLDNRIRNGVVLGWFDVPTYGYTIPYIHPTIWDFWAGISVSFSIISIRRRDNQLDNCGDPPPTNCRCTPDSCRVDCATAPDGFCCIDHAVTNRLLQTLQN
jgi:hypothetical protein